jgi:hypothetical protein
VQVAKPDGERIAIRSLRRQTALDVVPGCAPPPLASPMHRSKGMFDLVFVAVTIGFFALGVAYTRSCDHL